MVTTTRWIRQEAGTGRLQPRSIKAIAVAFCLAASTAGSAAYAQNPGCCREDGVCTPNVPPEFCTPGGGIVVPNCLGDLDGDGRDDACPLPGSCPLAPGNLCQGLQGQCAGTAGDCWPIAASVGFVGGAIGPVITECACITQGCGKLTMTTFADGTFAYRCLDQCPDPTQPCVIFQNGNPTASSAIHSSQIAPGDDITCDCKIPPPSVCPIETNTKICESIQAMDCHDDGTGDTCRPDVVIIGPNGQVTAKRCDCFFDNTTCGPVLVFDIPGAPSQISCDVNCPNPAVETCHIYRNGFSTGLISAPASNFAPGDELSCACDPIMQPVCPLPPTAPWCQNLQNINCRDGQPGEECEPTLVTVSFTGDLDICACDCLANECQEVSINPDATGAGYVLSCENSCPVAGQQCVIFVNGVQTTQTSVHTSDVLGGYVSCDCAQSTVCPLAPGNWCQGLANTDCRDGVAGEVCWPQAATISTAGTPAVTSCDCLGEGCGKMAVQPLSDGTFAYRCLDQCPDATQPCVIFKNGVATSSSAIHSSQIALGDDITCSCKPPPPPVCPLETYSKLCEPLQAMDCHDDGTGDTCRPDVVVIGPNGQVQAKRCDCYVDQPTCGPVLVIDIPGAPTQISCDVNCPDPTIEECHIYRNGQSTGLISAPATSFLPGDELSCACDPIHTDLCPMFTPWCQNLQNIMCRDGQPGQSCEPTAVTVDFHNQIDICGCDCLANECQEVTITPDPTGYTLSCDNACPHLGQQCVIFINGVQTNMTSIHSTQALGAYINCDCAGLDVCPRPDGPFGQWCAGHETTECLNGAANEECWPAVVSVNTAGQPVVNSCDCMEHCGPVTIAQVGTTYQFHCEEACETGEPCVIHLNGVSTGLHAVNATDVAPGDQITCDCAPPDPEPCPLETNSNICKKLQEYDCSDPDSADEVCRPELVTIGYNGQVVAKRCDCHPESGNMCGGPVMVINTPTGKYISCDFNCPDPASEQCVIFANGVSTGLIAAPAAAFPPTTELYCDCDPPQTGCPLEPGVNWCSNLQTFDCKDGVAGQICEPTTVSVNTAGGISVRKCDCLTNDCQAMSIIPDGAGAIGYTMRCDNACPTADSQCVIHLNGSPTTLTSIHSSQAVGHDVTCDCVDAPATCPMPTNFPQWCDALQATDCLDGAANEQCWPMVWSVGVSADGTVAPELRECDCKGDECGPVAKIDHADGSFTYRCIYQCPDPTTPCRIHRHGVPTAVSSIHSSQLVPGERITCECEKPPSVCPLQGNTKICEPLQVQDCKDGTASELCRPQVVTFDPLTGQVVAKRCDCMTDDEGLVCGSSIYVIEVPGAPTMVSCDFNCPDPANEQCVIFADGVSTGLIQAPAAQFPGQTLHCDCEPPTDAYCPLTSQSAPWCQGLQAADCKDDGTGGNCEPVLVSVTATGDVSTRKCDCVGEECRKMTILPDPTGLGHQLRCDNVCPDPDDRCVIHLNGVPTNFTSVSTYQVPGNDVSCDCVGQVCPLTQHWCNALQTTDCQGGDAGENCYPMVVSVTGPAPSGVDVRRCECTGDECGPVQITKIANGYYVFRCIDVCPPGLECQIHKNGVTTGLTSIESSTVTTAEDVTCRCAPDEPTTCPLPPNAEPWCANRPQDCTDGIDGDQCWPRVVTTVAAGGAIGTAVLECDCQPGQCGPVHITHMADGTDQYRCIYNCPDTGDLCRIHRNGVPTGLFTINSSMIAPGEQITCDCVDNPPNVCPLEPGQSLCAPRQNTECLDPQAGETCSPRMVLIGANGQVIAENCDCMGDGCGPVKFFPDPAPAVGGILSCDETCPTGQQCVIWRNGVATGQIQAHSSQFAAGDTVICDCNPPNLCELPPNQPWCDARRILDCKDGLANEQCRPLVVTTTTAGTPHVEQCDCVGPGCGPVAINQTAAGFVYRCIQQCPEADQKCVIHRNGVSTGVISIYANTVAPGEKITCDCIDPTPDLCPLDPNLDICLERQAEDCVADGTGQNCKAKVVTFDDFGNPRPLACDCYDNDGKCGPVLLFAQPTPPGGWQISCDQLCPTGENCVIHRNNVPTGLISAHSSQFAPGDKLSCGCNTTTPKCEPTADGLACTQCPTPGMKCVPTLIQWSPAIGKWRITECGCTDKCHIVPPTSPLVKPTCEGGCPNSPVSIFKKCIRQQDPVTGGWRCRCVPVLPPLDPQDPTVLKNRYLSMTTGGGALNRGPGEDAPNTAVRVLMDSLHHPMPPNWPCCPSPDFTAFEGEMVWAGELKEFNETMNPPSSFSGSVTVCEPFWDSFVEQGGFSIYGAEVVPDSIYSLQIVDEECADSLDEEECYSDPLVMTTGRHADMFPPYQDPNGPTPSQPNVIDLGHVVDQVKGIVNAIGKTRTHLHPNVPDPTENVNVIDIGITVDGIKNFAYPFVGPCTCPSTVACNVTTSCTSTAQCTGGRRCLDGVCTFVDACGRCTP